MKHNLVRYSMIVLLMAIGALTAAQANAQENQRDRQLELFSFPFGIGLGQTIRVSVANFADGSVRTVTRAVARIQLLDTEGDVIAQSDEIEVAPGKIRSWEAPQELLPTGYTHVIVRGKAFIIVPIVFPSTNRPPLVVTVEVVDSATGVTKSYHQFYNPFITVDAPDS